jgi:sialic acid synthase SpsE
VLAVTLGAVIIEKHLTLDKNLPGPDHSASLNPEEFKEMTRAIRNIPVILGRPAKTPSRSEYRMIKLIRKSIVTAASIKKGEKLTSANLTVKRPGSGIPPKYFDNILGKIAKRDLPKDILLAKKDF